MYRHDNNFELKIFILDKLGRPHINSSYYIMMDPFYDAIGVKTDFELKESNRISDRSDSARTMRIFDRRGT